jgi:hypothetical protein
MASAVARGQLEYAGWAVQALWTFIVSGPVGIYNIDYRNNKDKRAHEARG